MIEQDLGLALARRHCPRETSSGTASDLRRWGRTVNQKCMPMRRMGEPLVAGGQFGQSTQAGRSPERPHFLSFWPHSPETRKSSVNQPSTSSNSNSSGSANVGQFEVALRRACHSSQVAAIFALSNAKMTRRARHHDAASGLSFSGEAFLTLLSTVP
jgi:hypothetical protein